MSQEAKASIIVLNDKGLHMRPSTELVKCSNSFESNISLYYQGIKANAKSLLDILMLAAGKNAKIEVEAEGRDAVDAVDAIVELAENKFDVRY